MPARRFDALSYLAGGIFLAIGCGPSATEPAGSSSPERAAAVVRKAPRHGLGEYLPPLDDGRIEVAPPAGWTVLPRDQRYLARLTREKGQALPRIELAVADNPYRGLETVTSRNVGSFAARVAGGLQQEGAQPLEPPLPMILGDQPAVRYVSGVKLKAGDRVIPAERQRLLLLHDGRLYTLDLLVLPHTLVSHRDAAYAVCAGTRFLKADGSSDRAQQ